MIDMLSFFGDEMVSANLYRGSAGTYVNGEWIPDYDTPIPISIIFPQPLNQLQLQQLPEGERVSNFVQTWTKADVDVREGQINTDVIEYDGRFFLCFQLGDRTFSGQFKHVVLRERTADE